jgi:flagellar motility protein MotE (MotC chaperone)
MTTARKEPGSFVPLAALVAAGLIIVLAVHSAHAQDWTPTVATSPGVTFEDPSPGALNREPTSIDLQYFPSPRASPQPTHNTRRNKDQSGIETGALPQSPSSSDAVPETRATRDLAVEPIDLSPVRRTQLNPVPTSEARRAAAAKAELEKIAASDQSAPPVSGSADDPVFKKPGPLDALPPNASGAEQYCFNTSDSASDARFAWQAKKIQEMEAALDQKAQQLEAKTEEYKRWLARRDDFARKAHEKLVGFYTRMRPDAAAAQLATVDEEMAAAVMMTLDNKVAGAIMGEMDPERAAKIAEIISGSGRIPRHKPAPAANAAPAPASSPTTDASSAPPEAAPPPGGPRS